MTGTKPGEEPIMPKDLARGFDCDAFADFGVCPFGESKPGVMQRTCVESAANRAVVGRKERVAG